MATWVRARVSKPAQRTPVGDVLRSELRCWSFGMMGSMMAALRCRQESLLASMHTPIVGFVLLSNLYGFMWCVRHRIMSLGGYHFARELHEGCVAASLRACLTRRPRSTRECKVAFELLVEAYCIAIGRGLHQTSARILLALHSSDAEIRHRHTHDKKSRRLFKRCAVLRFADRSVAPPRPWRRISANNDPSLRFSAVQQLAHRFWKSRVSF